MSDRVETIDVALTQDMIVVEESLDKEWITNTF